MRVKFETLGWHSLMQTIRYGYFDDLLIGNFMKTELINFQLYPQFSPCIAKYGGNANKSGWKLVGFDDKFSWAAPFGWYDRNV